MFYRNLFFVSIMACLMLFGCQKEQPDTNLLSPSDALVKTRTEGNKTETYLYDAQKRVIKIEFSSPDVASYYHQFTYTDSLIYEFRSEEPLFDLIQTLPGGGIKINCTSNPGLLLLNENGLYAGTASNCESTSYQYDSQGFLISDYFGITDFSINRQFSNDQKNILSVIEKGFNYLGGDFTENTSYLYYTDKLNSIGNKNFGKSYLGKSSENLLKSESKNGETTLYTYVFDEEKRVKQMTFTKGTTQTNISYTYY